MLRIYYSSTLLLFGLLLYVISFEHNVPFMFTYILMTIVVTVIPGWVAFHEATSYEDQIIANTYIFLMNVTQMALEYCLNKIPENTTKFG